MADALPQLTPAFERPVDRCLFLFAVREACTLHLFGSSVEALGAYGVHRKEAECLRERYTIRPGVQKFNVRSHFPKTVLKAISPSVPSGIGPFRPRSKQQVGFGKEDRGLVSASANAKYAFCWSVCIAQSRYS
ncbi:MAG: hypothetical protein WAN17_02810 [Candidatus Sulfotelmatobacter sp.]